MCGGARGLEAAALVDRDIHDDGVALHQAELLARDDVRRLGTVDEHRPDDEIDGITHYCVANMPGAVPITSTYALTNATMPYVVKLADHGAQAALATDPGFMQGLNVCGGKLTYEPVANDQGLEFTPAAQALEAVPAA